MGNRIIKESICSSPTIDQLTWFEEAFFYRLMVNCDDYGRMDGRIPIIKSRLFPLKDITKATVDDALNKLSKVGLVVRYEANGQPYLQLVTWGKHQQIRTRKSKYPDPPDTAKTILSTGVEKSNTNTCNQMKSNEIICPPNPIQSNTNTNPIQSNTVLYELVLNTVGKTKEQLVSDAFDDFWDLYPKQTEKEVAKAAFHSLVDIGIFPDDIVSAVLKLKREKVGTQVRYYKKPADFLNFDVISRYLPKYLNKCPICQSAGFVPEEAGNGMKQCECADRYNHLGWHFKES